ncbi:MAG: hypothetical protein ACFE0R_13480 [Salinarimonas sp.]
MDSHSTESLPDHRDARLLRLGAALDGAVDAYWLAEDALRDGSERMASVIDAGWSVCMAIAERICATPAQTLDGLRVKARALAILSTEDMVQENRSRSTTIAQDIVRILGG